MDGSDRDRSASGRCEPLRRAGGVGVREAALWGGNSQGLQRKEWPQETSNSWGNRKKMTQTIYLSPLFATSGPQRQHRRAESRGVYPLWVTRRADKLSPVGLGRERGGGQKTGFEFSLFSPLFSILLSPRTTIFPIFTFGSLGLPSFLFVSSSIVSFLHLLFLSW